METATLIWLFVLVCMSAAACQTTSPTSTTTADTMTEPPDTEVPAVTRETAWVNFALEGVRLSLRIPYGWEGDTTDEGIVLAEHIGDMTSGGVLDSVQVHCFVHPVDGMTTPDELNQALDIVSKIVHDQSYISPNDRVSTPVGFTWDGYDAAYYLLNNGDGSLKLMLALAISAENLVACSISAPDGLAGRIRRAVPEVLESLTVNGRRLDGSSLHELPDPLVFPDMIPEVTADVP